MKEIWKPVKGYEGLYEVSNMGRLKSLPKQRLAGRMKGCRIKRYKERIITKQSRGHYYSYPISFRYVQKSYLLHRLVAIAFIPNPDNKPQVNHINGNKRDNRIENLEWVTAKENAQHASKNGLLNISGKLINSIRERSSKLVLNIKTGIYYDSAIEACNTTDFKYTTFYSYLNGSRPNKIDFIYV